MAVNSSATQKECHTPTAPNMRFKIYAAGTVITAYLINEIINEGIPFPRPSKAPEEITDIVEMIKPRLIILSALVPMAIVSVFEVNSPIS